MSFDYSLAYMTGIDLPIPELSLTLHQPTILEISYMGEKEFFMGVQLLCVDKVMYLEDESLLESTTNFQLFMTMINEKRLVSKKQHVIDVLQLLFPGIQVAFSPQSMIFMNNGQSVLVDENNFGILQTIVNNVCCLKNSKEPNYNPANDKAKEIMKKLLRGRQKVAETKKNEGSMFAQYLSVIAVGIGSMSLRDAMNLTIYQLQDLIERYGLYISWDVDLRARMAGAKGDKPIEDWMKQIH